MKVKGNVYQLPPAAPLGRLAASPASSRILGFCVVGRGTGGAAQWRTAGPSFAVQACSTECERAQGVASEEEIVVSIHRFWETKQENIY